MYKRVAPDIHHSASIRHCGLKIIFHFPLLRACLTSKDYCGISAFLLRKLRKEVLWFVRGDQKSTAELSKTLS